MPWRAGTGRKAQRRRVERSLVGGHPDEETGEAGAGIAIVATREVAVVVVARNAGQNVQFAKNVQREQNVQRAKNVQRATRVRFDRSEPKGAIDPSALKVRVVNASVRGGSGSRSGSAGVEASAASVRDGSGKRIGRFVKGKNGGVAAIAAREPGERWLRSRVARRGRRALHRSMSRTRDLVPVCGRRDLLLEPGRHLWNRKLPRAKAAVRGGAAAAEGGPRRNAREARRGPRPS
jgi:hypothetical protein